MDTSSSIRHRFYVEIPRGKFVEISSILKGESTWKLWHRFDVEISTSIRLSKSTKYRWVFHVDFSMPFRCRIYVTALLAVSFLSFSNFSNLGTYSKLTWYSAESMQFQRYYVITNIGTIVTISFGNFATTQIIRNKEVLSFSK